MPSFEHGRTRRSRFWCAKYLVRRSPSSSDRQRHPPHLSTPLQLRPSSKPSPVVKTCTKGSFQVHLSAHIPVRVSNLGMILWPIRAQMLRPSLRPRTLLVARKISPTRARASWPTHFGSKLQAPRPPMHQAPRHTCSMFVTTAVPSTSGTHAC